MSDLLLEQVTDEWLGPITLRIEPGVTTLTGDPAPLGRIVEILAGVRTPRRGKVTLVGPTDQANAASARVAALLPEEELVAAPDVLRALAAALTLRGLELEPRTVLESAGLADLGGRRPARLDFLERRAVMLALALADVRAGGFVLYDPLSVSPLVPRGFVLDACLEHARTKPVLVASPHLEDALVLGGRLLTFARGTVFAAPAWYGSGASVHVRSKQARRLAGLLAEEPGVSGVLFDAERAPFEVIAKSLDPEMLAESVTRLACDHGLAIASIVVSPSSASPPAPQDPSRVLPRAAPPRPGIHGNEA
ncbi:MAG TPA: hypothetical protein VIM73_17080 [Polyangiaceae bacterium]